MRLSGLRLPKDVCALFLVPVLACALVVPAGAEPSPNPPSAQSEGNPPAAEAEPNTAAEQPKSGPSTAAPESKPGAAKPSANAEPAQAGSQILINIDKSTQQMSVFVDGIEKYTWPVSTGKRGYSTPSGNYSASSMNEIWYSKEWDNAPMPHAIFYMKDGHAIHGSLEVKNLGKPASHGCVRISPKNAATLFTLVKANGMESTKVVIAGVTPGGEAKVAAQPNPRYRDADAAPWDYYPPRGLFGWQRGPGWGPGYAPPPRYREQRRGWFQRPRGYY